MIYDNEYMEPLFKFMEECKGVMQSPEHHPEGDVFIHSVQVLKWAIRESDDTDLILAAMLHDVGKIETNRDHYHTFNSAKHEKIGRAWLTPYCSEKTLWLIENHMRIWSYIKGEMKKLSKCQNLAGHPWLPELVQLGRFDKMGRNPNSQINFDKEKIMEILNAKAHKHFKYINQFELGGK